MIVQVFVEQEMRENFLVTFVLLSWHVLATSGRLIHMQLCRPPSACTEISKCTTTPQDFVFPRRSYCGFELNAPKICCLVVEQTTTSTTVAPPIRVIRWDDALVYHKNFRLLPVDRCGEISDRLRITSGASTNPGEFPWMALIAYKSGNSPAQQEFKCGGSLINERYILTAAHCIDNSTILGVRLGEYNIMTPRDCDPYGHNCEPPVQDLLIEKIITHKSYDPSTFINDIALIKLATKANYSYGNVRPVCLPFGDLLEADLEGQELTVAGWGTTEHGNKSMTLRKVSVPVVSTPTCRRLYQDVKPISKRQICAGADKGRDSCAGDSGGPLKRIDSINHTPRYVQYGIVSYGPTRCGIGGRPGIYTSVGEYMRWILDNLE